MSALSRSLVKVVAGLVAALVTVLAATPVWAHTVLLDASPGAGDDVAEGAELVALQFGDPVSLSAEHEIAVTRGDEPVAISTTQLGSDATFVCARVAPLEAGVHTLKYVVTAEDGHQLRGSHQFEVSEDGEATTSDGCDVADLPEPTRAKDIEGLDQDEFPTWAIWTLAGAVVVTAGLAVVAVVRSRRNADEDADEDASRT